MNESEDAYQCIGVCQPEPESGLCQGCGRPLSGGDGIEQGSKSEVLSDAKFENRLDKT